MVATLNRCAYAIIILFLIQKTLGEFEVPDVKIQVLKPKGFIASIPDKLGITFFYFKGNVSRTVGPDPGLIVGAAYEAKQGRWVIEDPDLELQVGDVLHYVVDLNLDEDGHPINVMKQFNYTVSEQSFSSCRPTVTLLRFSNDVICKGQTIFEDNFDSFSLDVWQIEQYIPFHSLDFPFVSYQALSGGDRTVSVRGGNLRLRLTLQQNQTGFSEESIYVDSLDLKNACTSLTGACKYQAIGAKILPPIIAGKVTSKGFAFTYGTVYVRAKLPQGDWIYPEILLEPLAQKFDREDMKSGVIKIASARGNKSNYWGVMEYSNKVLFGGPMVDYNCYNILFSNHEMKNGSNWGDDFHVYAVRWEPDQITLLVDDVEWAQVDSGFRRFISEDRCPNYKPPTESQGKMAPFDQHFYLTLGVAAGGIREFPDDGLVWPGFLKPWHNLGSKSMYQFWHNRDIWYRTWNQPQMLVDYVKVVAL